MLVTCERCASTLRVSDRGVPVGRSFVVCPQCRRRINVFKGVQVGSTVTNLTGIRFLTDSCEFHDSFCEPGELWKVVQVFLPCPDKGLGKRCERENRGRCPNQRLIIKQHGARRAFKTCLYRCGRRIFDRAGRAPVGHIKTFHSLESPSP